MTLKKAELEVLTKTFVTLYKNETKVVLKHSVNFFKKQTAPVETIDSIVTKYRKSKLFSKTSLSKKKERWSIHIEVGLLDESLIILCQLLV